MEMNIESKNAEKQQQLAIMEEDEDGMSVPNWLIDVLKWITRIEMANSSLSFSCKLFIRLCWPKLHGNVKAHSVKLLDYFHLNDEFGNICGTLKKDWLWPSSQIIPIASTPPPEYIRFEQIFISFLDDRVLEFIKCISSKIDGVKFQMMNFEGWELNERDERTRAIQCLLNMLAGRIVYFYFGWHSHFKFFTSYFANFIDQCQFLRYSLSPYQKSEYDDLLKWLTNRREMDDTKQKILYFSNFVSFDYFIGRIKEEFSNSTRPINFIVFFYYGRYQQVVNYNNVQVDLNLENEITGEVLKSYSIDDVRSRIILRCPKSQEERWKKEYEEKMSALDGGTLICMDIKHFGTFTDLAENAPE